LGVEDTKAQWGQITGTLTNQTDLVSALDLKAPIDTPTFTGNVKISNNTSGEILLESLNSDQAKFTLEGGTVSLEARNQGGSGGLGKFLSASVNGTNSDNVALKAGAGSITISGSAGTRLSNYTSTSRSTDLSSLNPVQNYQPATDDTLAELCVDKVGDIVKGSQEATWTFSRAQLNTFTGGEAGRITLLQSPGSGKCIVVEESNWFVTSDPAETGSYTADLMVEIEGTTLYSSTTKLLRADMDTLSGVTFNGLGMYSRNVPASDKILKFNKPMTLRTVGASSSAFPNRCTSIKLKIKYRVFDSATF